MGKQRKYFEIILDICKLITIVRLSIIDNCINDTS